ncbi:hypothetical protein AZ09_05185 [Acetobacter aceti 1023]|nr:hypothetical protein AZ09_05185 [Acetobacter aceti 1023]
MAYGAPTNLDLSACNVTATGGSTVQTLADLGKAVGDNATAVAAAQDAASSAQTTAAAASASAGTAQTNATAATASAATALTTAQAAQTTAAAAQTTANAAVPSNMAGKPNGYAPLDSNAGILVPISAQDNKTAVISFNEGVTASNAQSVLNFYGSGANNKTAQIWSIIESDSNSALTLNYIQRVRSFADGYTDLGMASMAWNNIYSKTAVQVTSDATQKTIIGSLGDANYADGQKLASALFGLDTAMFQLNASIAAKGAANARLHAGFIAQQVEAAITAAGLDPAKYALWTNSPVYETTEVDTGKKDAQGNAITESVTSLKKDANGNQVYTQMLRYDQILCVLFEACKAKIAAQDTSLASLNARIAVLETKIAATGGAA